MNRAIEDANRITECAGMRHAAALPCTKGAYGLLVTLHSATPLPARFHRNLAPGLYCYLGSAWGPGGIRARCRRHLRRCKTQRWHIDWLTTRAAAIEAVARPGLTECALTEALLERPGIGVPIHGFGSSDCRRCPSHLLRAGPGCGETTLRRWLLAA